MTNRAVFFDRDGTLIEHYDYLTEARQVELTASTAAALRLLKDRGFLLVMVTNQSAVARGMITEEKLLEIHDRLKELLAEKGAYLDQIYYCPYHRQAAIERYRRESNMRKPAPGMLLLAANELDIDLAESWMIGDDDRDIEAGKNAGCKTVMLENRNDSSLVKRGESEPDFTATNLKEAANIIVRYAGSKQPKISENGEDAEMSSKTSSQPDDNDQDEGPIASDAVRSEEIARRKGRKREFAKMPQLDTDQTAELGDDDQTVSEKDLLGQILRELRSHNRGHSFTEFSISKLLAGVLQMLVFLCLVLVYWYGSGPEPNKDATQTCLLLALILQTMTLTLLVSHRQQ